MVGYRNNLYRGLGGLDDFIRHSDGGVSELKNDLSDEKIRLYQAFRWWGIGTQTMPALFFTRTLSGIPMVGYRNFDTERVETALDFIRHSDGGVSEPPRARPGKAARLYQAFRWWGIGTTARFGWFLIQTLSGIPMVGYRNSRRALKENAMDFIRHSDGGVSELPRRRRRARAGLYQAFRWWGIGT